nr:DUF952 domain-containing protein [Paenibacillus xylanexedens]
MWEDLYNEGREYPHIYGELNLDAVFHTYVEENELKRMEPN